MKSITLEEGLDVAYPILKEQKAMLVLDLCREIIEKAKADAGFSYAEFLDAAEEDTRFQVMAGQIVGLARNHQDQEFQKGLLNINEKRDKGMDFTGTWHIYEMEAWDEDYFNMEVQAYIRIDSGNLGVFQFGLVSGGIDGKLVNYADGERFEFTWDGNDECDPDCGSGWIRILKENFLEGKFRIHLGDDSTFLAIRAK
jgi:hypothetical protein